jgi:hypothetical protein
MKLINTARETKKNIELLDYSVIPVWNKNDITLAFNLIRNFKHLNCSNIPNNLRVIPWLFPENGCFIKSTLAIDLFKKFNFRNVSKFFVFGNFKFKSKWSSSGYVTYKDHVAVSMRVDNDIFILDPTVHYSNPLLLDEWIKILVSESENKNVEGSICSQYTFSHNCDCLEENPDNVFGLRKDIQYTKEYFTMEFLAKEFEHLINLGLDPKLTLGIND